MQDIVAVHGSYFARNFGDMLLIRLLCDYIQEVVGLDVRLAVPGSEFDRRLIGYPVVDQEKMREVRKLVFAGGGYFGEPPGGMATRLRWSVRNHNRHLRWNHEYARADLAFFGIGVGPLGVGPFRWMVKDRLKRSSLLIARDEESIAFCRAWGISHGRLGVDYALSLFRERPAKSPSGIALIHLSGEVNETERAALASLRLCYPRHRLLSIEDQYWDQGSRRRTVSPSELGMDGLVPFENVDQLLGIIEASDIILTNKLHVGITGLALGAKVISLPRHPKTARLYRQLGLTQFCMPQELFDVKRFRRICENLDEQMADLKRAKSITEQMERELCSFLSD